MQALGALLLLENLAMVVHKRISIRKSDIAGKSCLSRGQMLREASGEPSLGGLTGPKVPVTSIYCMSVIYLHSEAVLQL